eukprot:2751017-Rhodomonas_salina.1
MVAMPSSFGSSGTVSVTRTVRTALMVAFTGALLVSGMLVWTSQPTTSTVLVDQTAPTSSKINEKVRDELLTQLEPHELEKYSPEMSGLAKRVHNELLNLPKIEERGVDSNADLQDPDGSVASAGSADVVKVKMKPWMQEMLKHAQEEQAKEIQQDLKKEVKTQEVLVSKGEEVQAKLAKSEEEVLQPKGTGAIAKTENAVGQNAAT